jgi:hypothetical protein
MKKIFFATVLLATSYGFAADPAPAPEPSIQGTWNLTSRACTSNALINDGVKIGQDTIAVTNNADNSFQYKTNIGGCETTVNGTYMLDGMKVTYTSTSSQSCKETAPVPMTDTHSMYVAYLSDLAAVTVTTGDKAAMSCPAGDALVMHFDKAPATP